METKVSQGRGQGTGGSGRISQRLYEYVTLAREHDRGSSCCSIHQPCLQRCWPLMTTPPPYCASAPWPVVSIADHIAASMVGWICWVKDEKRLEGAVRDRRRRYCTELRRCQ